MFCRINHGRHSVEEKSSKKVKRYQRGDQRQTKQWLKKELRTNNGQQDITQKTKDRAQRTFRFRTFSRMKWMQYSAVYI
jgi:hypothetical protein